MYINDAKKDTLDLSIYKTSDYKCEQTLDEYSTTLNLEKAIIPDFSYFELGVNAIERKDYESAIYYLSEARSRNYENPDILYNRALAKFKLNKTKSGCKDLKKAAKMGDKESEKLHQKHCL